MVVVVVVVPALRNCRPETRAPHLTLPHRFSAFSGKYSGALVSDGIAYFIPSSASNVGTGFWKKAVRLFRDKRALGLVLLCIRLVHSVYVALCHCRVSFPVCFRSVCVAKGV